MKTEEAIEILENEMPCCGEKVVYSEGERCEAYDMAISALRARQGSPCSLCGYGGKHLDSPPCTTCPAHPKEQKPNAPLTLGELRKMDGDKIYIQFIGACKGFYDDEYAPYYGEREQYIQKYNGMLRACDLPLKYYGESWLAYRCKPEEATA